MGLTEVDLKKIEQLVTLLKDSGVKRLEHGALVLEFFESVKGQVVELPSFVDKNGIPVTSDERIPTEDEMLMYSTEAFDEMIADRTKSKEKA